VALSIFGKAQASLQVSIRNCLCRFRKLLMTDTVRLTELSNHNLLKEL